jgi:hypothetical protein
MARMRAFRAKEDGRDDLRMPPLSSMQERGDSTWALLVLLSSSTEQLDCRIPGREEQCVEGWRAPLLLVGSREGIRCCG